MRRSSTSSRRTCARTHGRAGPSVRTLSFSHSPVPPLCFSSYGFHDAGRTTFHARSVQRPSTYLPALSLLLRSGCPLFSPSMVKPFRRQETPHRPYVSGAAAVCETTTESATTDREPTPRRSFFFPPAFLLFSLPFFSILLDNSVPLRSPPPPPPPSSPATLLPGSFLYQIVYDRRFLRL